MPDPILGSSRWWPDLKPAVRFLKPGEWVPGFDGGPAAPQLARMAAPPSPAMIGAAVACVERTAEVCGLRPYLSDQQPASCTVLVVGAPPGSLPAGMTGWCWRPSPAYGVLVAVSTEVPMEPGSEGWAALWHGMGHAWGLGHAERSWYPAAWGRTIMQGDSRFYARLHEGGPFMTDFGDLDVAALVRANGPPALPMADEIMAVAELADALAGKVNKANRATAVEIGRRLRALIG